MRRSILVVTFLFAALVLPAIFLGEQSTVVAQHGFSVKQYEEFHDVLAPLQHEALPMNDLRRIRKNSALLVKRGRAIVKVGMPASMGESNKDEFTKCLNTFNKALVKFEKAARKGSNTQLKTTYIAVHDTFETLAETLPRN